MLFKGGLMVNPSLPLSDPNNNATAGGGQRRGREGGPAKTVAGWCQNKQEHGPGGSTAMTLAVTCKHRKTRDLRPTSMEDVRLSVQPVCLSKVLRMTRFSASTQSAKPSVWPCSPRFCFSLYIICATPSTSSFLSAMSLARTLCAHTSKISGKCFQHASQPA